MIIVNSDWTNRIECPSFFRICYMYQKWVCIGEIIEEANDALETDYVFKIYWDKWEEVGEPDIEGINTDLRLKEYIRSGIIPQFISIRVPPDGREDIPDRMKRTGMTGEWDFWEYMIRNNGRCSSSVILVGRTPNEYIV